MSKMGKSGSLMTAICFWGGYKVDLTILKSYWFRISYFYNR